MTAEKTNLDLSNIRKAMGDEDESTPTVGGVDWMSPTNNDDDLPDAPVILDLVEDGDSDYDGPGVVIDDTVFEETEEQVPQPGLTDGFYNKFDNYLKEFDEDIEEQKELSEQIKEEYNLNNDDEDDDAADDTMSKEEFGQKYEEAIIIIDKSNFGGRVFDFTEEEKNKLERSKKIKLEEIETVELSSIKTKKKKKKTNVGTLIQKQIHTNTTQIVLPASGYTAIIKGCSAHEVIALVQGGGNPTEDLTIKWSLIFDKIENTSIGKMTYNQFLMATAAVDYPIFIYGILCSTYPDDDVMQLSCTVDGCKKDFEHRYSMRSLIRAELMNDRLKDLIMNAVDNSYSIETSEKAHKNSPVSMLKTVKMPDSGFIFEFQVQSAYDLINKSAKELIKEDRDTKKAEASLLSTTIRSAYVLDDEDGEYFEIDTPLEITDMIFALGDRDSAIFEKMASDVMEGLDMQFGFMDVTCPACKAYTPYTVLDIEKVLFYRYQQVKTTSVE